MAEIRTGIGVHENRKLPATVGVRGRELVWIEASTYIFSVLPLYFTLPLF
jgi:hypothetical protein